MSLFGKSNQIKIDSLLHKNTEIKGDIFFDDGMLIDCVVFGNVHARSQQAKLVIGPNATIHGSVQAGTLTIAGKVFGPVEGMQSVLIQTNAQVTGNIRYGKIQIEEGALIKGHLDRMPNAENPKVDTVNQDQSEKTELAIPQTLASGSIGA